MFVLVKDQNLFHRVSTRCNIFTSGEISFLVFTRWNKFRSSAETNKFSFYFMPFPWLLSLNSKKIGHVSLEIAPHCVHKNDVIMTSRTAGTVSRCISWFLFLYWPVTKSWYFSLLFFTANKWNIIFISPINFYISLVSIK